MKQSEMLCVMKKEKRMVSGDQIGSMIESHGRFKTQLNATSCHRDLANIQFYISYS